MKGKMYLRRARFIYKGEDVFMQGKMCLWRGRCIYERKMYLWRGRCVYAGEDVFMKGKMYLWKEDVFMKGKMCLWRGRCIYEEENVFVKGKMYLWKGGKEKKMKFLKKKIEWFAKIRAIIGLSHFENNKISGIFERKITMCKNFRNFWIFCNFIFIT